MLGAVVSGGKMVFCAGADVSFVIRITFSLQIL
jgi:enoyl-CoA hydratase/carnithine racemase